MTDSSAVMQEMIDNHEDCRILTNDNGQFTVKLRPNAIIEKLQGKLAPEDIASATQIANHQNAIMGIRSDLYLRCFQLNCSAKDLCPFRSIPNGDTHADVMFIGKTPTQYEACNFNSHSDKGGVFLSLILKKLGVARESVYCTDMIKCHTSNLDKNSYNECVGHYLSKEIEYVAPKLIICDGLSLLKACMKMENPLFLDLPSDIGYGKIYDAHTPKGLAVKVMAMYDLDVVLNKTGEEYDKCKTDLWQQLLTGFKSLTGE